MFQVGCHYLITNDTGNNSPFGLKVLVNIKHCQVPKVDVFFLFLFHN